MTIHPEATQLHAFSPPPRRAYPRWESIAGPNFQYFLHVLWFSLFPLFFILWLVFVFTWAAFGKTVDGRFTYTVIPPNAGAPPRNQMQVEYPLDNVQQFLSVSVNPQELQQLGMPNQAMVQPGKPLLTAPVPVHVLQLGTWHYAVPIFPSTWIWLRLIPPLFLTILSTALLLVLHGELVQTLRRSYRLVKDGVATSGTFLGTHETGWWESSGEYSWTYIRRYYVDYAFLAPDGHEYRGCQLVLGAMDPDEFTEKSRITILYDPENPHRNVMYVACAFRTRLCLKTRKRCL